MSAQSFREIIGVPGSTASPKDSTLVIIDAQNEYAEGKLKVSNAPESRKAIAGLLKKYRDANGNVVHVKHVVPEGKRTDGSLVGFDMRHHLQFKWRLSETYADPSVQPF